MPHQGATKRFDISKLVFYSVSLAALFGFTLVLGLYSGAKRTPVFWAVDAVKVRVEYAVATMLAEAATLAGIHPDHFLQPSRHDGDGVTVNEHPKNDDDLILLAGFFGNTNELRLIRRDGTVVARWPVRFSKLFPDPSHLSYIPATDWNVDTHGALALSDGSVVFNFEYGGLVKLDRCGEVVWTLARATHHSVERAEGGGFWVPGRRFLGKDSASPFPPFETPLDEDTLLKVSDEGKVLTEISVPRLFYDNGLEALLTATGDPISTGMVWDQEIVHLNKIAELSRDIADDFPMFEAGDLALSIRELNLVMVVAPDTGRIKWWQIGPWLRQHDPEFKPGGTIVVFNNNTYRTAFGPGFDKSDPSAPRVSNIIEIDPATRRHEIVYGGTKEQALSTVIRGKHELTPKGGLLITEFEGGRAFEIDAAGRVIWEYINRYSAEEVAEITEARVYPASYFTVSDWSCGSPSE